MADRILATVTVAAATVQLTVAATFLAALAYVTLASFSVV